VAKNKKKMQEKLPEVLTAHRGKPEQENFERESDRPNGCSGNYS